MSRGPVTLLCCHDTSPKRKRGERCVPRLRFGLVIVGLLSCTLVSGCKLTGDKVEGDPLKGDLVRPPTPPTASKEAAPSSASSSSSPSLPEIPSPATVTSTAALAGGVKQTLDPHPVLVSNTNGADLNPGILLSPPQPVNDPPAASSPGDEGPVSLTGQVVPLPSEPVPQSSAFGAVEAAGTRPIDPGFTQAPPAPVLQSFAQLEAEERSRGVSLHEGPTQIGPDLWEFSCFVPDPQHPNQATCFTARAPGEGGLAAVRKVLADIDRSRQR